MMTWAETADAWGYAPDDLQKEAVTMASFAVSAVNVALVLAVSAELTGIVVGVLITIAVALAASVTRLVRLAIAIAELWLQRRLEQLAEDVGVDPDQAEGLADDQ